MVGGLTPGSVWCYLFRNDSTNFGHMQARNLCLLALIIYFLSIYQLDLPGKYWDETEKAWAQAEQNKWVGKRKFNCFMPVMYFRQIL